MKRAIISCLLLILSATNLLADEYPYIYRGIRPLGMGGAFVAVSDDVNALFYNPAGLADIKSTRINLFPLELSIGQEGYDLYDDQCSVDFDNEQEVAAFLRDHLGEQAHLALNLTASYEMPRYAFCLLGSYKANLSVHDRQFPKLNADVVLDVGGATGYAHPFLDDRLLLGANLKYIDRHSLDKPYSAAELTASKISKLIEDDMQSGRGAMLDLGLIYKIIDPYHSHYDTQVNFGVVAVNALGGDLGKARDEDAHLDVGLAVHTDVGITKATFAVDYVDLLYQLEHDKEWAKRLHLGAEFRFPRYFTIRCGLNQGYISGGISLATKYATLDLATYGEETGASSGQNPDRRFTLRVVITL